MVKIPITMRIAWCYKYNDRSVRASDLWGVFADDHALFPTLHASSMSLSNLGPTGDAPKGYRKGLRPRAPQHVRVPSISPLRNWVTHLSCSRKMRTPCVGKERLRYLPEEIFATPIEPIDLVVESVVGSVPHVRIDVSRVAPESRPDVVRIVVRVLAADSVVY